MSWGGPPQQQQYGAYGQPASNAGYANQPGQNYGAPQQAYGRPQNYGGPPTQSPYGGGPPQGYGGAPPPQGYGGAPPPQGYGGAPPPQGYGGAPPPQGYGGAHQPPPGVNPELWQWFQAVDADHSGKITAIELQQALTNGNWSHFNAETCRLMIGMFDKDRNGTIDIYEFAALWKYIQDWKQCFDGFDKDRSGNIDAQELTNAFTSFGYRLSPQFSQTVIRTFDRKRGGQRINFDDFIQACVMLKSLTDKFRGYDTRQQGMINISYEQFLEMVLDTKLSGI